MFGFSSRSPRNAPSSRGASFRPSLETLEARVCPSTINLMVAYTMASSKQVTLFGQVSNTSSPGGQTVFLSGVVGGSATTDSNGNFTATLQASGQGAAYAATSDGQSNIAQIAVTDPGTRMTNFMGIEEPGGFWLFTGTVNGGYQGEVVNFSGLTHLEGKSTTTDSSGNFRYCVQLDGQLDDMGDAYAQATDAWGGLSNEQSYWCTMG